MKTKILKTLLAASATVLTSACSSVWNGEGDNPNVTEKHPISVDSQVVTLTLDVDPTLTDLSTIDQARLRAFANAYLQNGHGPITVTTPSGATQDDFAQEMAADIRQYLNNAGISYTSMTGASYRNNARGGDRQMVISYTHYVATPSSCGVWTSENTQKYKNISHPNFGCADQNNLAAMISDPRDLIIPADGTPSDATGRVRAIEAFRAGEVPSSQTDGEIETQVSN